jgi:hypothetical protein
MGTETSELSHLQERVNRERDLLAEVARAQKSFQHAGSGDARQQAKKAYQEALDRLIRLTVDRTDPDHPYCRSPVLALLDGKINGW